MGRERRENKEKERKGTKKPKQNKQKYPKTDPERILQEKKIIMGEKIKDRKRPTKTHEDPTERKGEAKERPKNHAGASI